MEEKKKIKISLSTLLLLIAIIIIIVMGIFIYNLKKDKTTNYQIQTNSNNSLNESTIINQSSIESAIQKYFDIRQVLASDTINVLYVLELKSEYISSDKYDEGFYSDKPYTNSYFIKTDVSYDDFEQAISKYMTIELFEKLYPNYVINKDGFLCIYSDGGTTGKNELKECKISKVDSNTYMCNVISSQIWDDDGRTYEEETTITVIEKNGIYIVSECY